MSKATRSFILAGSAGVALGIVLILVVPSLLIPPPNADTMSDTQKGTSKEPLSYMESRLGGVSAGTSQLPLILLLLVPFVLAVSAYFGIRRILRREPPMMLSA